MRWIRNQLVRATAVTGLGLAVMAGFVAPASAAPVAASHVGAVGTAATASGPNTNIQGSPATWSPNRLTVETATGTCSTTNNSFTITNTTSTSQTISSAAGSETLTPGQVACICAAQTGTYTVNIDGSSSVLTVTVK